jgi:hypothetical protein
VPPSSPPSGLRPDKQGNGVKAMSDDFNPIEWITTVAGVQVGKFRSNHWLARVTSKERRLYQWQRRSNRVSRC